MANGNPWLAAAMLAGLTGAPAMATERATGSNFPIVELRQYTLREGKRDVLIGLFEREFIESQEALGMKVIGTFTDLDRPNRFVWLRGFKDMDSRLTGLTAFYGGPVWQAHRSAANATMIDSDNVFLLHAPCRLAEFQPTRSRPVAGEQAGAGIIVATIYHLSSSRGPALGLFKRRAKPLLEGAGVRPIAWFVSETTPNNFPRLPVREGEPVLIWFARFEDERDRVRHHAAFAKAAKLLAPSLAREPEVLRLRPTARSELR